MSRKIYVEGGGDSKSLRTACRKGFRLSIENAGIPCREVGLAIVACGDRRSAYDTFKRAHSVEKGTPILLVDADGPVNAADPWRHLHTGHRWERPNDARDDQCHLMVEVMESWFLADKTALASFYGQEFQTNALPGNPQVEQIPKADVLSGLTQATRNTKKGRYDKGSHSFDILGLIDPVCVERASPHAKRLLDTLRSESLP